MRIEKWKYNNVTPDGIVINEFGEENGAVIITPMIRMSQKNGGCNIDNCKCSKGHWIMIGCGIDLESGSVEGITAFFDNWGEMQLFLLLREVG